MKGNNDVNKTTQDLMEAFIKLKRYHQKGNHHRDLKHSEMYVLFCIKKCENPDNNGLKVSEISMRMQVSNPTTTQCVNKLVEKGYVKRNIDEKDRRVVRIALTEKGEDVIEEAGRSFVGFFDGVVNHIGEEKSMILTEIINEVIEYLSEKKN